MIDVFIENEAGSDQKNLFDEKTLEYEGTVTVSRPYPLPYGFILDTTNEDGDNLDCYVLTERPLKTGDVVTCKPIGMMEQVEDGDEDNNILAVLEGETTEITEELKETLAVFSRHVFSHAPAKTMKVGSFLGKEEAASYIASCRDFT